MNRHLRALALTVVGIVACSSAPRVEPAPAATPVTAPLPVPTTTQPVAIAPAPAAPVFRPSRIVASKDSFVAVAGGQTLGTAIINLARERENFRFSVNLALPAVGVAQNYEGVFNATTLMPVSGSVTGQVQGVSLKSDVAVVGGRAKGTAVVPGPTGVSTTNVDLEIPPGTVDDQASAFFITTLDLVEGLTMTFKGFDASSGDLNTNTVRVTGKETVTVPAGTFETFRVLVQSKTEAVMYVTTSVPRRIVLLRVENGQVELRLLR